MDVQSPSELVLPTLARVGDALSPEAVAALIRHPRFPDAMRAPHAEIAILRQACGRDYQANCAGVPPGGGHAIACLAANQAKLSPGCQRALAMAKPGT